MDDVDRDRLKRRYRRTFGAAFAAFGIVLLVAFVLGLLFLIWLWILIEGSPTIS
jgi:nitrate reductase NapE component